MRASTHREVVIKQVVDRYYAAITVSDEEAWIATFASSAVSFVPAGASPLESRDDLRRVFRGLAATFERIRLEPDQLWHAPDGAAVKWTCRATGRNGRDVAFEGVDVFKVDESGRIRTVWSYWDPSAVVRELEGAEPPIR